MIMLDDFEQVKRDLAQLEKVKNQFSGREKEIIRRLKQFGVNNLKEGVAAKKKGKKDELEAAAKWQRARERFEPVYRQVKELLEEME